MNKEEFINICKKELNIDITDNIFNKLIDYYELLVTWNKKFNLTTITKKEDVLLKHFYDSLCLVKTNKFNEKATLCDVGTGAGFPGIVLKIVFDNLDVTLIEAQGKKCMFLNEVIEKLNLKNIKVIQGRAEELSNDLEEKFDIITMRAVSRLRVISEISLKMLKVGGFFLPLKANVDKELEESKKILDVMGCEIIDVITFTLPIENANRSIVVIKKECKTNENFPRMYSKILKQPM